MKDGTVLFQVGLSRVKKSLKEAKRDLGEGVDDRREAPNTGMEPRGMWADGEGSLGHLRESPPHSLWALMPSSLHSSGPTLWDSPPGGSWDSRTSDCSRL